MKKLLILALLTLVVGCKAYDSLIGHPLHVLHSQHEYNEANKHKPAVSPNVVSLAEMAQKRDGTNYIGVYLGMIAEHDGKGGVMMFSATSGQCLKWIPYKDFDEIFVKKTKPEYP